MTITMLRVTLKVKSKVTLKVLLRVRIEKVTVTLTGTRRLCFMLHFKAECSNWLVN